MLMMRPPPRRFMCGMARRQQRTAPISFRSMSDCQASSLTVSKPPAAEVTRVVDEDVEAAELRDGGRDEGLDVRGAAHVRDLREDLPARRLPDAVGGLLQALLAAAADRDARALAREPLRRGPPEPVAAPGDDGYLAVQSEIEHAVLLSL